MPASHLGVDQSSSSSSAVSVFRALAIANIVGLLTLISGKRNRPNAYVWVLSEKRTK